VNFAYVRGKDSGKKRDPALKIPLEFHIEVAHFCPRLNEIRTPDFERLPGLRLEFPQQTENCRPITVGNCLRQGTPALSVFELDRTVVSHQQLNAILAAHGNGYVERGISMNVRGGDLDLFGSEYVRGFSNVAVKDGVVERVRVVEGYMRDQLGRIAPC
jgi:hypothetical protein